MSTGVIIVSYHTGATLKVCIAAVRACPQAGQIVLVDNGNDQLMQDWMDACAQKDGAMTILRGQGNVGFSRGCNAGTRQCSSDQFLFLNPDAILQQGALAAMQKALADAPPGSVAGARLLNSDGSEQRGSRRGRLTPWAAFVSMTGLSRFEHLNPVFRNMHQEHQPLPAGPAPVHAVSGACMLINRQDFEKLGGFDERYFLHVEDLDLCRRVRKIDGRAIFVPDARVIHVGSTSHKSRLAVDWYKAKGLARYYCRFAHTPLELAGAWILAIPLTVAVMGRALYISLREYF